MTHIDDLAAVIRLACLTEDRTDQEQQALLRIADRADHELNKATATRVGARIRPLPEPADQSALYDEAQATRYLVDDQRRVELKKRSGTPRCPVCGRAEQWTPPAAGQRVGTYHAVHDDTCPRIAP